MPELVVAILDLVEVLVIVGAILWVLNWFREPLKTRLGNSEFRIRNQIIGEIWMGQPSDNSPTIVVDTSVKAELPGADDRPQSVPKKRVAEAVGRSSGTSSARAIGAVLRAPETGLEQQFQKRFEEIDAFLEDKQKELLVWMSSFVGSEVTLSSVYVELPKWQPGELDLALRTIQAQDLVINSLHEKDNKWTQILRLTNAGVLYAERLRKSRPDFYAAVLNRTRHRDTEGTGKGEVN